MDKITELRQEIVKASENLNNLLDNDVEFNRAYDAIQAQKAQLERALKAEAANADLAKPSGANAGTGNTADTSTAVPTFRDFGDQCRAVMAYRNGDGLDNRLMRAPTGAGEVDPSGAGFLVQTDFANTVLTRIYDTGEVAQRVMRLPPLSGNSIKIPAIDETSRANGSRFGGVQAYWVAEGASITGSKPKFRQIELDLKKVAAVYYASDELLADTSLFGSIASLAFGEELTFALENSIWQGTGAGQPLGFMNAPCKITVAKEKGQASGTLVYENILNMWSRMWGRSRTNAVWFIDQSVEPQLYALSQVIGTAGVPVYLPANGISGNSYGTLFGRPVVPVEYASQLGTEGDIVLADMTQYVLAEKGGIQAASSIHLNFLQDECAFRLTYRVDGEPWWSSALTPFSGGPSRSPFVSLASR